MNKIKEEKLLQLLNNLLDSIGVDCVEELLNDLDLRKDLEIDSISYAELVVLIEEEFDVNINEIGRAETVGDIKTRLSL